MEFRLLYITTARVEEARRIGRALVEERLAACANIVTGLESIYHWQGAVVEDKEVLLIVKTRAELVDAVIAKVKTLHSYTCPCVVALPILAGNPAYLEWLGHETRESVSARS
ncbi:MAG TPA: divalent-cation tolerance protein CutA [Alphaproteobacteria bacterium]|nr:divalent-cation tolerance protein CutA [Alphaproteobacteria bacterium]